MKSKKEIMEEIKGLQKLKSGPHRDGAIAALCSAVNELGMNDSHCQGAIMALRWVLRKDKKKDN